MHDTKLAIFALAEQVVAVPPAFACMVGGFGIKYGYNVALPLLLLSFPSHLPDNSQIRKVADGQVVDYTTRRLY